MSDRVGEWMKWKKKRTQLNGTRKGRRDGCGGEEEGGRGKRSVPLNWSPPSPPLLSNLIPMEEETKMEWRRDQSKDSYLHPRKWMGSISLTSRDPREWSSLSTKSNK